MTTTDAHLTAIGEPEEFQHLQGVEAREKIQHLLKSFRACMMITSAPGGALHIRPMGVQGKALEFAGTLWFFTARGSAKIREAESGAPVTLIFQNDGDSAYLTLQGVAHEIRDRAKMEELYSPIVKTWFPEGLDDPNITLLQFDADTGSFWESPGGKLQGLAAFAQSLVTGKPGDAGTAGDLQL